MFDRVARSVGLSVVLVALAVQPVLGLGYNGGDLTGNYGEFRGPNRAEVVCWYNAQGRLRSMTVKPLTLWGAYDAEQLVGWRFKIRTVDGGHALIYASPIQKDMASKTLATDSFSKQVYRVRDNGEAGTVAYYVRPIGLWYVPGTRRTIDGKARLLYDRYLVKRGTQSHLSNACAFDYESNPTT